MGLIPNDQSGFVNGIRQVITNHKQVQQQRSVSHTELCSFHYKQTQLLIWKIIISYIYIALEAHYIVRGEISSSTTSVQHPPGWSDGSHIAPERPSHTSLLVERRQSDEVNQ